MITLENPKCNFHPIAVLHLGFSLIDYLWQ